MIRTRFAPSPTGFMHIGNLRTALYAYLIAKHEGGDFLLRIEDTDQARLVAGSTDFIFQTLAQAGIDYDEGPGKEGGVGPYIQSERRELYKAQALHLVKLGGAYHCFCEKVEDSTDEPTDRKPFRCDCAQLDTDIITAKLTTPHVIRQVIPAGQTTFSDSIYGDITVDNSEIECQVLLKADGYPTYNFANVVDDHHMHITHVIRGSEYLSSTPKYNLLYQGFGWPIPTYIHLPLILGDDKAKLSKRNGDANFADLLAEGYLAQAIINYIAMLGWSPATEDNQEVFSMAELIAAFQIKNIGKSPAVFDKTKLTWFNQQYLQALSPETFYHLALPYLQAAITRPVDLQAVAGFLQSRVSFVKEVSDWVGFIDQLPDHDIELYSHKKMKTDAVNSLATLQAVLPKFEATDDYSLANIKAIIQSTIAELEVKNGIVLWPIRTAMTGTPTSFCGAAELIELLGKTETLARLQVGIQKLQA